MTEQTTALATRDNAALMESVVVGGDLSKLKPGDRLTYYRAVCESVGLNPLTRPFEYITLNGKLTLYAKRDCTDQLRKIHGVSITDLHGQKVDDLYIVTAKAMDKGGRVDSSTGAVNLGNLKGEAAANAIMKCETKAKRRVTLSLCGLGLLDETEVETIADRRPFVEGEQTNTSAPADPPAPVQHPHKASEAQIKEAQELLMKGNFPTGISNKWFSKAGVHRWADMPSSATELCIQWMKDKIAEEANEASGNQTGEDPAGDQTAEPAVIDTMEKLIAAMVKFYAECDPPVTDASVIEKGVTLALVRPEVNGPDGYAKVLAAAKEGRLSVRTGKISAPEPANAA